MTELAGPLGTAVERCGWCRRLLERRGGPGRPRAYCRRSCRQRAYEARQAAGALDWAGERIRAQTQALDEVVVLGRALSDVLEPRSVGPPEELQTPDVEDLLERLRTITDELLGVVGATPAVVGDRRPEGRPAE